MSRLPDGAWAKPLRGRVFHFFSDRQASALCGAYQTRDVLPSEFGTGNDGRRCPTCERKLSYFLAEQSQGNTE